MPDATEQRTNSLSPTWRVALCVAERRGVVVTTDPGDIDAVGLDLALIAV